MIQRRQTIYLVLGALAMGALFFLGPLWSGPAAKQFGWFTLAAAVLAGLTAAGALGAVCLYRNRSRQRAVVAGVQVLTALTAVLLFVSYYAAGALGLRGESGALDIAQIVFLVLPVAAYVLFFLARRAIRSDIELVKSMDRLR
jgi:ABC-type multidrug transport system fused ATPase/permease subunit